MNDAKEPGLAILHIITGLNDGGAEAALYRLCVADKGSRHHVVSMMNGGKYGPMLEAQGVCVTCLNMPRGWLTRSGLLRLWKLLRAEKPDVVQTWMYHADLIGGMIARLAGIGNINWGIHHSTLIAGQSRRSTIFVAKLCGRLSRWLPRHIVCCAQRAAKAHSDMGYDATRMRVIPNGYDLQRFRPDPEARVAIRAELGLTQEDQVVGFVARYDPLKDHGNFLHALSLLRKRGSAPTCLLIGAGMDEANDELATLIADQGLHGHIRLLGQRNDIPAVMNALDIHVMSSMSEAFPNVLAEAMACGTPCISTDVGDASIIIGDTGWVVPLRDSEALANAMMQALKETGTLTWTDRKSQARARVETHFSIKRMVASYRETWGVGGENLGDPDRKVATW